MSAGGQNLSFGLLLPGQFQWLDAAGPVDLINSHSRPVVQGLTSLGLPQELVEKAPVITWHYISSDRSPIQASSGPPLLPTATYADCPPLDYLVVPGPDPTAPLPPGCAEFLKERFEGLKGLLTVCTGSTAVATTGLLDGYKVCTNKFALKALHAAGLLNKKVTWVGDRRWIVDRKVWSAAGVTAGLDLGAEFVRVNFDPKLVEFLKGVVEYKANPDQPDDFAYILEGIDYNN
ncbi:hypothetical protein NLJ89_g3513 [Agrocybe chaxingu]|uniref:DJ-1/PfpI domain-containing protein n=1 Tax=Agrocybe chaxingu TaxID=84603 RepID=A0A9W8MYG4_9AGAR|nr:hypothetical protein NLJ89_g3513 [Agrocybe chaxingu]